MLFRLQGDFSSRFKRRFRELPGATEICKGAWGVEVSTIDGLEKLALLAKDALIVDFTDLTITCVASFKNDLAYEHCD